MRRALTIITTVVALALCWPAAASAASGWVIQPTPTLPGGGGFSGVSCFSATGCTAVGTTASGSTVLPLAEGWNGSSWSVQATPVPAGATLTELDAVFCASATDCTAVGRYRTGSGDIDLTLAEHWDGSAWSVEPTPNPADSMSAVLVSVSCAAPGDCVAAGDYLNTSGIELTLAEHWNGSAWSMMTTPSPGADQDQLTGVSCVTVTDCTAIGLVEPTAKSRVLVEHWDGTSWSVMPNNGVAPRGFLEAISCATAGSCTAVGVGATGTVAVSWNGRRWTPRAMPHSPRLEQSNVTGVSCLSAANCTAVGSYGTTGITQVALVEHFTNGKWHIQATPNPTGNMLIGVSCTAAGCTAAGFVQGGNGQTLIERN